MGVGRDELRGSPCLFCQECSSLPQLSAGNVGSGIELH